ncbi:hypothetical protein CONPUDRAFT_163781 [Coniophora puteana RWD-64-598 SS2]|uniref:DUF6533 domain-containing protein n=1 Tax=Coniophora puteana (strain RWD-64-598) TaxID=741705 RepID=A0A5M3MU46_CONPW|nr:uncharacterized protein CONPUDRAFT_163781 [Coniophora puteana RWD-64-598 SS2]EIW82692.1 hypothetical protein CONPUDRAFT_163781 [Coniophora puteana RWD-64-598 SS2]
MRSQSDTSFIYMNHGMMAADSSLRFFDSSLNETAYYDMKVADVQHAMATVYVGIFGFTVLVWDHFLTFSDEVEIVWKKRKTLMSYLFIVNRYATPFGFIVNLVAYTYPSWSVIYEPIMSEIGQHVAGFMMFQRVMALYGAYHVVCLFLALVYAAWTIVALWLVVGGGAVMHTSAVHSCTFHYYGKPAVMAPICVWLPLLYDTTVLASILKRTLPYRPHMNANTISRTMATDGILYYGLICTVNVLLVIMIERAPVGIKDLLGQIQYLFVITMTSRITLSLPKSYHKLTLGGSKAPSRWENITTRTMPSLEFATVDESIRGSVEDLELTDTCPNEASRALTPVEEELEALASASPSLRVIYLQYAKDIEENANICTHDAEGNDRSPLFVTSEHPIARTVDWPQVHTYDLAHSGAMLAELHLLPPSPHLQPGTFSTCMTHGMMAADSSLVPSLNETAYYDLIVEDAQIAMATACVGILGFTVLVWDHLLTFSDEVSQYAATPSVTYIRGNAAAIQGRDSMEEAQNAYCERFIKYEPIMSEIGQHIAAFMMFQRVMALYGAYHVVCLFLILVYAAWTVVSILLIVGGGAVMHTPVVHSCTFQYYGNTADMASICVWLPLLYGAVVLTSVLKRTFSYRPHMNANTIARTMATDAILFYGQVRMLTIYARSIDSHFDLHHRLIFTVNVMLVIMVEREPHGLKNLLGQLQYLFMVTMTSRITLSLPKSYHKLTLGGSQVPSRWQDLTTRTIPTLEFATVDESMRGSGEDLELAEVSPHGASSTFTLAEDECEALPSANPKLRTSDI